MAFIEKNVKILVIIPIYIYLKIHYLKRHMQKPNICPKCSNTHFYEPLHSQYLHVKFPFWLIPQQFSLYLCAKCGYSELYFDEKTMIKIKEKFKKEYPTTDFDDVELPSPSINNTNKTDILDKFCPNCSYQLTTKDKFCSNCGSKL